VNRLLIAAHSGKARKTVCGHDVSGHRRFVLARTSHRDGFTNTGFAHLRIIEHPGLGRFFAAEALLKFVVLNFLCVLILIKLTLIAAQFQDGLASRSLAL